MKYKELDRDIRFGRLAALVLIIANLIAADEALAMHERGVMYAEKL